ncbi:aldehyde dehydrogenase family protein [Chitinophaga filiformis]|uniref:aldehyde dehydrogenase family protein n=1 Tax=Chitinophaga filiformis TaxID=104663 RepID=UPI001F1941C6|nr:aldehyde dehydrogenase family protein [Chitinophaga filiformis]MCF6406233.1 aldehyde dehydrogenase family protein [Chitinophaga filiformis]
MTKRTTADSMEVQRSPKLNWINGEWVDSLVYNNSINPATGDVIGRYAEGGRSEAAAGIAAAKAAFTNSEWKTNRHLRSKALHELADAFEKNAERLMETLAVDNGKIKSEARMEVSGVPSKLRYYAALVLTQSGRALETQPGAFSMVLEEPVGVAGIIAPWNSPVILLIRSLAPALAAGCTAIIKMPGQTAQVNALICEIFAAVSSLPKGVINQFTESGNEGAAFIISSPDVPTISYTGSTATAKIMMKNGADNLKRFGFELGGKTPMIILDDADLNVVLPVLQKAVTLFAGQFCMTGSRILVQKNIAPQFIEAFTKRLQSVKAGPATDPVSEMGPLINKENVDRVDKIVEEAIVSGAKVLLRGGRGTKGELAKGAFYLPALLLVTDNKMAIVQEETFGPVATIQIFDTIEEAIELANDNKYGLAASVWSTDVDLPLRMSRKLEAGTVWINNWARINDEFEEGGYKMSGLGRLNGIAAMHEFIQYKHIYHDAGSGK